MSSPRPTTARRSVLLILAAGLFLLLVAWPLWLLRRAATRRAAAGVGEAGPHSLSSTSPRGAGTTRHRRGGGNGLPAPCETIQVDAVYRWLASTFAAERRKTRAGVAGKAGTGAAASSLSSSPSWGDVLDAGAGLSSMCFVMRQRYRSLTEVTAVEEGTYGRSGLREALASAASAVGSSSSSPPKPPPVHIVVGNWQDENLLRDHNVGGRDRFDVVLADYLLGAAEEFWPYGADVMLGRVLDAVKVGGYLFVVGVEPYETSLQRTDGGQAPAILDVEALGDAAALLSGRRSYRELPEAWVLRHLARAGGVFRVVGTQRFPMKLGAGYMASQVRYAEQRAGDVQNAALQAGLLSRAQELAGQARAFAGLRPRARARNYAIVARRVS